MSASTETSNEGATTLFQRGYARTLRWPLWVRVGWWVLFLPAALALFSAGRLHGWPRGLGLGMAGFMALIVGIGVFAEPPATDPSLANSASAASQPSKSKTESKDAAAEEAAADQAAAEQAAAEQAAAEQASADKAAADKAAADKAAADKAAADKAAADKAAADKAAADKAAADKAAADKAAAEQAAADKAAAEQAAAEQAAADKAAAEQAAAQQAPPAGAKTYANCTELRKDYRGGVARQGAVNQGGATKYQPHYDNALYEANTKSDRDKDGIACEA